MPSDYYRIREDNIREYGLGTRHLSFLGRLYTDRTHFVFELLQNAEDAGASRVLFQLFENRLEVFHNGRLFIEKDVRGICGVGEGTKAEDLTQIGKFGIGFKSVYAYTSTPEVHSGDESFRIENYVRPYATGTRSAGDSWTTLFVFPHNAEGINPKIACREISERLSNLSARTLLFLHKIREIEYKLLDGTSGVYLRDEIIRGPARQVTVIGQNNGKDEDENWLLFERDVKVPNPCEGCPESVPVEIGFRLENNEKEQRESIERIKDSPLFVSFPTEKETRFGFLIQGPYKTTPARDNIPKGDDWNTTLVRETAHLLADVLRNLKEMGLLSVPLLEALPIRTDDFSENSMFYPIVEAVRDSLMNEDLLPADDGTFVSAPNAKLARGSDLRKLLNQDQLCSLFPSMDTVKWLAGEITQDRTPDLRTYLLNELDVEEITPDSFARKINHSFLESQTDEWFIEFYRYLLGQEALWRTPRWSGGVEGLLRVKAIIRLQDDSQVTPFRADGTTPNVFLPPPEETDFPIVKRSIAGDDQVMHFLGEKRLGLSEPDIFDDIVQRVLPKYMGADASSFSQHEHATDIQKILRAMDSDSEDGKKKVVRAARQTPFLRAVDRSGGAAFKKPGDLYLPTHELTDYFLGSSVIWFLDETEGEREWLELGVAKKPRFKRILIDLPWDERNRLIGNQGHTRDIEIVDYDLDGIDNFLSRFPEDNQVLKQYSLIVWSFLLQHLKECSLYRFYEGEYKWFYYQERSAFFDATWKKRLRCHAWMSKNGSDTPHRPSELTLSDLPVQFEHNERLADLLGMKKDVVAKLADEVGIPTEDIDLLRKYPEEFSQWKALMSAKKDDSIFPTRPSANPERREQKIIEKYKKAPKKKYEKITQSTKTTGNIIDPKTWLSETYKNDAGELICQICKKEMPFKKKDGHYYFESVEIISDFDREMEEFHIALCPLCAARYNEFVKLDENAMKDLKHALKNSDDPEVPIKLDFETSIRFVESHFSDIKTILEEKKR